MNCDPDPTPPPASAEKPVFPVCAAKLEKAFCDGALEPPNIPEPKVPPVDVIPPKAGGLEPNAGAGLPNVGALSPNMDGPLTTMLSSVAPNRGDVCGEAPNALPGVENPVENAPPPEGADGEEKPFENMPPPTEDESDDCPKSPPDDAPENKPPVEGLLGTAVGAEPNGFLFGLFTGPPPRPNPPNEPPNPLAAG